MFSLKTPKFEVTIDIAAILRALAVFVVVL